MRYIAFVGQLHRFLNPPGIRYVTTPFKIAEYVSTAICYQLYEATHQKNHVLCTHYLHHRC